MVGSMNAPQGGGAGGMQENNSLELSAKYTINSGRKAITSKKISQTSADSSAVLVTNGAYLKMTDTTITKTGDSSNTDNSNFYGLNAAITVQQDSTMKISGGTIDIDSSKLFASGDGSPCIYSTGDITANNCSGKATGSQIVVVEGKNSITLNGCTFIGAGKNEVMLYQSTSGDADVGTAVFTSEDSTLKTTSDGPMFYITNTDALINLKNTKLVFGSRVLLNAAGNNTNNWGKVENNGGNVTLNADS